MLRERSFWKSLAWLLAALLAGMMLLDVFAVMAVPPAAKLFTLSCLFCIGVGYSVVSPRSSPVQLDKTAERTVRERQLIVGLAISVLLGLVLLMSDVRKQPESWLLMPVIALAPVLLARECVIRARNKSRRARDAPRG